jgi:hypothetical protein
VSQGTLLEVKVHHLEKCVSFDLLCALCPAIDCLSKALNCLVCCWLGQPVSTWQVPDFILHNVQAEMG